VTHFTLADILTPEELAQCRRIYRDNPTSPARTISEQVIQPALPRINKTLGQENDPMYLAYAVEHVLREAGYVQSS
jgi:hypothetical protein